MTKDGRRLLIVSSSGGVVLELMALRPWWSRHDVRWAAVRDYDTAFLLADQPVTWLPDLSARRPLALIPALLRARRLLRSQRPDLIVSAGSGPAIPFFLLARLDGIPTFWVATLNVLSKPGASARICGKLAERVLVQRPEQLTGHPSALVVGELY